MAILTIHHWSDPVAGLRELVRVARQVMVFAYEPAVHSQFWLWQEYFPAAARVSGASEPPIERVVEVIGADRVETVLVPHDCMDGFGPAYWRRPGAYLNPEVRSCISGLARLTANDVQSGSNACVEISTPVPGMPAIEICFISTRSTPASA